ncbi:MAG TPA: 2-amino-4-hydroxy-6-hydroxymethyldihydropteridine diphosphokinase [Acidimicrobiia bacterium]
MTRVAVGLGSNLGDPGRQLQEARRRLQEVGEVVAVSSIYQTEAIGPPQADYLNMVMLLETELPPGELMARLLGIERSMGRQRRERLGPRVIDLDLLLFGDRTIEESGLKVPHPRMLERRFVLEPLMEVWPDARLPDGRPVADFLPLVAGQRVGQVPRVIPVTWPTARMRFRARGGWFVVIQLTLFALVVAAAVVFPETPSRWGGWSRWLGGVLAGAAIGMGLAGLASLGRSLTPLPAPGPGARFTDRGIYGLVRHPIYGALILGFPGLAIWQSSLPAFVLSVGLIPLHWYKARFEESLLVAAYRDYEAYRTRVRRRFLPWVW